MHQLVSAECCHMHMSNKLHETRKLYLRKKFRTFKEKEKHELKKLTPNKYQSGFQVPTLSATKPNYLPY